MSDHFAAHGEATTRAVEWAARQSYGRLMATLTARTRDVAAAEDALSDAFSAALTQWPQAGVPASPDAWLLAVARRRLIDGTRRMRVVTDAAPALEYAASLLAPALPDAPEALPDRRCALLFACAHPAIDPAMHAPLMLQAVLGLEADQIAAAFLVKPSAMAQRLVRVKRKLRDAGVSFAMPEQAELSARAESVLNAIYAAFGTAWDAVHGGDATHISLADEAIWLARVVVEALPTDAEAIGLLALLRYCDARRAARVSSTGAYVPLDAQSPNDWDAHAILEAEQLLIRASALLQPGRFQTEAAIQSAHVERARGRAVDGGLLVQLYDALLHFAPTVGAMVNRAAAIGATGAWAEALVALDVVPAAIRATYQPWWALRAHLLAQCGDRAGAAEAYDRAIGLTTLPGVRTFLLERRAALPPYGPTDR